MKLFFSSRRLQRLNIPGALLVALLQRTPVVRVAAAVESAFVASPIGTVLRSAAAAVASLGAMHSLAGATPLVPSSGTANGISVAAGSSVSVAYTVTGTETRPLSWTVSGAVPPGLNFSGLTSSGTVNVTTLQLTGTPTAPGTYGVTIMAWEGPNATMVPSPPYSYTVTVTGSGGGGGGGGGTGTAPVFTLQPATQTIATGGSVVFNASATGATGYRWQRNGSDVNGATGPVFVISNASSADAGSYTVIATNGSATATSNAATLSVTNASAVDTGHLRNLSVRTASGAGDQLLNVGFALGGNGTSGTKPLLIRVTGPALSNFGVTGTMADPTITVQPLGQATISASNDNWAGNATVVSTSAAVGAFPLTDTASKDAAVVATLQPGTYTALAGGTNGGTGIVLTEIYDATPSGSFSATTPRLRNVSARAQVASGQGILIAGFEVAGATSKTLLLRATGPALAGFGVGGTLADPKVEVYVLGGAKLYENDNWGGSSVLASTAASVGAFPINDPNSKDAVLLVTLPPGVYTAQVSGVGGGTGVALIEVYEVP